MSKQDKIKWDHVRKWVDRAGLKTTWKPYGMPEVIDPFTSRFADVDPMPKWKIPGKVMISTTITGAFFSKRANPNQPITVDEIRDSAEECIKAGAPNIHIHVRDDGGFNALDPQRFHDVIAPLRKKYPEVMFDGCLVAVTDAESAAMESTIKTGLFDALPVNTTAICCGDSMFFKAPHVVIEKTRLVQEAGYKPIISVYDDGDIDNARRFLVASGGKDARTKLGLPGGGPRYVVTPLCVMDFEEETKRMRLKSLHPGISVDAVVQNTGFELVIPTQVPTTPLPTQQQLHVLRSRIDVGGALRQ